MTGLGFTLLLGSLIFVIKFSDCISKKHDAKNKKQKTGWNESRPYTF
jgi:hypothetical protein